MVLLLGSSLLCGKEILIMILLGSMNLARIIFRIQLRDNGSTLESTTVVVTDHCRPHNNNNNNQSINQSFSH